MHAWLACMQLCAVADRADAHKCIDFLNARGACVCFTETCAPPDSSEWYQKGVRAALALCRDPCPRACMHGLVRSLSE
jgi:hypothetical protein